MSFLDPIWSPIFWYVLRQCEDGLEKEVRLKF